jgi:alpha-methylacyl-CoA racemase
VLTPAEAVVHSTTHSLIPHPHPRLSRTPAPASVPESAASQTLDTAVSVDPGAHTDEILRELGVSYDEQQRLMEEGVIGNKRKTPAAL